MTVHATTFPLLDIIKKTPPLPFNSFSIRVGYALIDYLQQVFVFQRCSHPFFIIQLFVHFVFLIVCSWCYADIDFKTNGQRTNQFRCDRQTNQRSHGAVRNGGCGCSGSLIRRMMSKISCFVTRSRPLLLLSLLLLLSPTLDTFSSKVNICEGLLLSVVLLPTGLRKEAKVVRVEEVGTVTEESFNL